MDILQPPHRPTSKSSCLLDDPEHWFHDHFPLAKQLLFLRIALLLPLLLHRRVIRTDLDQPPCRVATTLVPHRAGAKTPAAVAAHRITLSSIRPHRFELEPFSLRADHHIFFRPVTKPRSVIRPPLLARCVPAQMDQDRIAFRLRFPKSH